MLETGQVVGRYEIIKPLGAGGEGCVYLARDNVLSRLVAVKRIGERRHGKESKEEVVEAGEGTKKAVVSPEVVFLRELRHPMLPAVYDLFYEGAMYLVMEYIEGYSLHNYIEKMGYVEEEQGRIWAEELLTILEYLHKRRPPVIYRDLKPQNIIVCPDKKLRLVDLGAACLKSYGKAMDGQMALTPGYGAPEQMADTGGRVYADERSDIYAFGGVLYYMLTGVNPGKPPYGNLPVRVYNPLAGEGIERVIAKCVREDPGERYQMVEEIYRDLHRKSGSQRGPMHKKFLRHLEKRVWLTEKQTEGL